MQGLDIHTGQNIGHIRRTFALDEHRLAVAETGTLLFVPPAVSLFKGDKVAISGHVCSNFTRVIVLVQGSATVHRSELQARQIQQFRA
jgi:hypothetical protein